MADSRDFRLQTSLEGTYLNVPLGDSGELDEITMGVLTEDCPEFLIPFRLMSHNDRDILKYKLPNTTALRYCNLTLSKAAFMEMYLNLLRPFVKGRDWFLNYHNLCVDESYVYLDKHMTNAFFIYMPEREDCHSDEEILEFFRKVLKGVRITGDSGFLVQLYQYFDGGDVRLTELYRMVEEESKRSGGAASAKETRRTAPEGGSSWQTKAQPEQSSSWQTKAQQEQSSAWQNKTQQEQASAWQTKAQPEQASAWQNKTQPEQPLAWKEESQLSASEGKEKKKGLFGGMIKKKEKEEFLPQEEPAFDVQSQGGDDEVMALLFGDDKKKQKEKPLKPAKEKKAAVGMGMGLFGGKKKAAVFESDEAAVRQEAKETFEKTQPVAQQQQRFEPQADPVGYYYGGETGETEISEEDEQASGGYLELIGASMPGVPQTIGLNFEKSYIILGRISDNAVKPDVAFGADLKKIGRMHARIERSGEGYCVIDLGSANHTLLNGEALAPNHPYPMRDGDELALTKNTPIRYRVHL